MTITAKRSRILFTKQLPGEVRDAVEGRSLPIDDIPFITIEERDHSEEEIEELKGLIEKSSAIIFTSANAISSLIPSVFPYKGRLDKIIYAVGDKTADIIDEHICPPIVPYKLGSKGLIEEFDRVGLLFPTLHICGDKRMDSISDYFKKKKQTLHEWVSYSTVETPPDIDPEDYAGIAFFSPSGVKSYRSKYPFFKDQKIITIGATTAEAVKEHGGVPTVAKVATFRSVAETMIKSIEKVERQNARDQNKEL